MGRAFFVLRWRGEREGRVLGEGEEESVSIYSEVEEEPRRR